MLGFYPLGSAPLADDGVSTVSVSVSITVVGQSATGAVGSVTAIGNANTSVTGVSATGVVGVVTTINDANTSVTGVSATGAVGSVTAIGNANTSVTGVSATGVVGVVTTINDANTSVTGVSATGVVGTPVPSIGFVLTGVSVTSSVGQIQSTGTVFLPIFSQALQSFSGTLSGNVIQPVTQVGLTTSIGITLVAVGSTPVGVLAVSSLGQTQETSTANIGVIVGGLNTSTGDLSGSTLKPLGQGFLAQTSLGETQETGIIFDYEAVKDLYSHRRTILLPRVA